MDSLENTSGREVITLNLDIISDWIRKEELRRKNIKIYMNKNFANTRLLESTD